MGKGEKFFGTNRREKKYFLLLLNRTYVSMLLFNDRSTLFGIKRSAIRSWTNSSIHQPATPWPARGYCNYLQCYSWHFKTKSSRKQNFWSDPSACSYSRKEISKTFTGQAIFCKTYKYWGSFRFAGKKTTTISLWKQTVWILLETSVRWCLKISM